MENQRAPWRVSAGPPDPAIVERLLRLLPAWFGIESANAAYVQSARHLPSYFAWPNPTPAEDDGARAGRLRPGSAGDDGRDAGNLRPSSARVEGERATPPLPGAAEPEPVGVLLATRHFPSAAEIHLLAVDPSLHRRGVGRALVAALEADLIADGVKFLQVKTLGPARRSLSR
jgi:ribosomal protein S18 acetylase RimI-like enzyme